MHLIINVLFYEQVCHNNLLFFSTIINFNDRHKVLEYSPLCEQYTFDCLYYIKKYGFTVYQCLKVFI